MVLMIPHFYFLYKESTDQHHQEIKELEEVKESLGRQLKTLQEVLDNQIEKYKEQVHIFPLYILSLHKTCFKHIQNHFED